MGVNCILFAVCTLYSHFFGGVGERMAVKGHNFIAFCVCVCVLTFLRVFLFVLGKLWWILALFGCCKWWNHLQSGSGGKFCSFCICWVMIYCPENYFGTYSFYWFIDKIKFTKSLQIYFILYCKFVSVQMFHQLIKFKTKHFDFNYTIWFHLLQNFPSYQQAFKPKPFPQAI